MQWNEGNAAALGAFLPSRNTIFFCHKQKYLCLKNNLELEPRALYVNFTSFNLNLVVNDTVSDVRETYNNYFSLSQSVTVFFGNSINSDSQIPRC